LGFGLEVLGGANTGGGVGCGRLTPSDAGVEAASVQSARVADGCQLVSEPVTSEKLVGKGGGSLGRLDGSVVRTAGHLPPPRRRSGERSAIRVCAAPEFE
jgi:hypothetical protein